MTDAGAVSTGFGSTAEVHELPFSRDSNRRARSLLKDFLGRQTLPSEAAMDAAIVIGELVANGLDHGRPDLHRGLEVSWQLDGATLRLSVLDGGGSTTPHVMPPDLDAPRGRGLAMVQALSTSWWFDREGGTRVTAVLAWR
ncbi:ATP-binding protein [Nocardioides sp. MAHUQ-72]|uniref:ATP-binding protein n=1 Tax=unclassified Nocardioides TaxID=2615069 RepID=UPI00360FC68D